MILSIVVIASVVIMLAWLKKNKRKNNSEDGRLPIFVTCQSGTSAMLSGEVDGLGTHGSTR